LKQIEKGVQSAGKSVGSEEMRGKAGRITGI